MKNYNGMVYIPNDLLDEILRIPVENEDTENEYWVGQILFAYAALAQKNDKKPTPEELSNFTKKNIDLVRKIIVEYSTKGWLERLDAKDEDIEHDKSRNLNLTESNLDGHE